MTDEQIECCVGHTRLGRERKVLPTNVSSVVDVTDLTKARQQTALGQELALGAMMLGINSVDGNPMELEFDFRKAWRSWPHASEFPSVKAGPANDDLLYILTRSSGRTRAHLAYWEAQWPFIPTLTVDDWTADELAEIIHDRIPTTAWAHLVRTWLAHSS